MHYSYGVLLLFISVIYFGIGHKCLVGTYVHGISKLLLSIMCVFLCLLLRRLITKYMKGTYNNFLMKFYSISVCLYGICH